MKTTLFHLYFLVSMVSTLSSSLLVPTEQIQELQTAAPFLDQIQRLRQDRGPVQQPRLPAGRPAAAGVLVCSHHRTVLLRFLGRT